MPPLPSVVECQQLLRTGEVSSRELVDAALGEIERNERLLNAWCHLDADGARARADAADRARRDGREAGPLDGIPFGVKDLEDCAGMPTTKGSRWFTGRPPATRDEIHVGRVRAAGAIAVGKTTTPEFGTFAYTASPLHGVTGNPWDPSRTPGGSSGGSAAAVASGSVPFATASDGGGSIRTPAAFCGLPGLRPMYGRIPTWGVTHLAQNAVHGVLATTVADTALLLDVIAGPHPADRTCLPPPPGSYLDAIESLDVRGLRAAWSPDLGFATVDPEVAALTETAALDLVAAAGLELVDLDWRMDDLITVYTRIEGVDMFVNVPDDLWRDRVDELDPLVAPGWRTAPDITLPKLARVEAARREIVAHVAELLATVDVLLTPSTACPPFAAGGPMPTEIAGTRGHGGMAVPFPMLANLVNLPSMSVPAGLTAAGLPVGLMINGPRFREDLVLRLARVWEQHRPWPRHAPSA